MNDESNGMVWGSLRKAWRGYKLAKSQKNAEAIKKYAERIIEIHKKLGVTPANFPELGVPQKQAKEAEP